VAELRAEAGGHEDDLRVAALSARQGGLHHELAVVNRQHRLLQAALNGTPVAPPDGQDRPRLELIEWFEALSDDEQWATLLSREPRLSRVADDVRSGLIGPLALPTIPPRDAGAAERKAALGPWLAARTALDERLSTLLGPGAETDDLLLRSHTASEAADRHLMSLND